MKSLVPIESVVDRFAACLPADPGRMLFVVPPFATLDCPSHAAHLLQALGAQREVRIDVAYLSLAWGSILGEHLYMVISRGAPYSGLSGERLFAPTAFGLPPSVAPPKRDSDDPRKVLSNTLRQATGDDFDWSTYERAVDLAPDFIDGVADAIVAKGYRFVACTVTFEQNLATIALLKALKARDPEIVTLVGGSNCQGEMAEGMAELDAGIDYIFSGECDDVFPVFLENALQGDFPEERIVRGTPCTELDELPSPEFAEFFAQRRRLLPDSDVPERDLWLSCESSRGCWWGQKSHCTFCGFNGTTLVHRERSPDLLLGSVIRTRFVG